MSEKRGLQSLFHQKLDRALFASYLIGAVVPLVVLAWLVHAFALPGLAEQGYATATVIGVLCGAGVLVLSGYFATRRIAQLALARMNADNAGLSELLFAARALAKSEHAEEVAGTAARCALVLVSADASFVVACNEKEQFHVLAGVGHEADRCAVELEDELGDLAATALAEGRASSLTFDRAGEGAAPGRWTAVAVPLPSESTQAVLVALRIQAAATLFGDREIEALDTLAGISAVALDNADHQQTQRNFFAHVTDMLVMALDAHVDRRSGHATRVAQLANRVARELELDEEAIKRIHFAALLHDLGMLKVAPEHQRIPAYFQKHSAIGARMLSRIRLWRDAAPIVLHHHENYDGSGYPNGLVGEAIPLESRIVLVVDAFDAMTRDDDHRPARPTGEALSELRRGMGTQFDPDVVRAFLDLVQRGEIDTQ
jgi:putative nucleotidyltransferase with HDIG domain